MKHTVRRMVTASMRLLLIPALSMCGSGGDTGPAAPVPVKLAIAVQPPATVTSGTVIAPPIVVAIQDASSATVVGAANNVTLSFAAGTNTTGAVLGGTLTKAAVGGLATFDNVTIDKVGAGYMLTASASGLTGATTTGIAVTAGAASKLAITTQPTAAAVNALITPSIQVAIQDAQGNTVTSSTANVTLAITGGTGAAGAALGGTVTQAAVGGVATFTGISVDKVGAGYTLTATSAGLTNAVSSSFTINPGPATKLVFSVQPTNAAAGSAIAPAIQVQIQDAAGNVTTSNANVTLAITGGTGTAGAVLGGTVTVAAVNGTATFNNITVDKPGAGYTLTASGTGVTSAISNSFTIAVGAAAKLAITAQPTNTTAGATITPSVVVTIQDAAGNTVTSSTANVTLGITTGPGGSVLGGTTTRAAVAGVATFNDLHIDLAGTGYVLTATSTGLTSAPTNAFNITAGAAAKLGITQQPGTSVAGATIAPSVKVAIQDALGNTVTSSTANVTVAITGGTGTGGAVLGGTLTQAAVAGVATFGNLTIDLVGTGYTLTATSAALTNAVTNTFDITAALLTIAKYVGDGQTGLVGFATNVRPAVLITDPNGPVAGVSVTFAIAGGGGSVTNATVLTNAQGIAQVGSWVLGAGAGANSVTATGTGAFAGANNVTFNATGDTKHFNIEIRNIGPAFSPSIQAAFNAAEALWESIIYGEMSDVAINTNNACALGATINETVDDIIILAKFDSIDGPSNVLGSAGACSIRTSNGMPIYGAMRFDTADMASLSAASLNAVILHEMGHVLGFSSAIFNTQAGVTNQRLCAQLLSSGNAGGVVSQDTHFDCTQAGATNLAKAIFDSIGGTNYTHGLKVPLENCTGLNPGNTANCGPSTYNSHWRESEFGEELMTGFLNSGSPTGNPLSVLTVAAMGDQTYQVNYAAAEAYTHAFSAPSAVRAAGTMIDLTNDHLNVPIVVVDDRSGRIMRVIPKR